MRKIRLAFTLVGLTTALAVSGTTLADKAGRDKKKGLEPKVSSVGKDVKGKCGCGGVTVDWGSYGENEGKMFNVERALDAVKAAVDGQCTDAESKKAFCAHVSDFKISFKAGGGQEKPAHKGPYKCFTDGDSYCNIELGF